MSAEPQDIPRGVPVRDLRWRRSSYSTGTNNCVEAARSGDGRLTVRDSKTVGTADGDGGNGATLLFSGAAWTSFVAALH